MHLNEKLAEYIYEELPAAEMDEIRRHVSGCAACKARVEEFEHIHHALKAMPDEDLPRRVVIEPAAQKKSRVLIPWRWAAPLGVTAAILLALGLAGPIHLDWHDSQLTIAFGKPPAPVAQPADYQRIVDELTRLEEQSAQVKGHVDYMDYAQRRLMGFSF
jgi:anti-sigma factor RsiW